MLLHYVKCCHFDLLCFNTIKGNNSFSSKWKLSYFQFLIHVYCNSNETCSRLLIFEKMLGQRNKIFLCCISNQSWSIFLWKKNVKFWLILRYLVGFPLLKPDKSLVIGYLIKPIILVLSLTKPVDKFWLDDAVFYRVCWHGSLSQQWGHTPYSNVESCSDWLDVSSLTFDPT